ncbi:MAG: hypothetical protein IJA34_03535 [Lachnospiraceae bacterium]|nr:hypothetical protein [Lachnospiraceae bacterium]
MNKQKIIMVIFALSSIFLLLYGILITPISEVKINLFKRVFYKKIYFKDVSENAIYIFLILSLVTIVFLFAKYKFVAVISSVISYVYMIREIYKLYDTYSNLGNFKDNIEICFGMHFVVVGNTILLIMSICNYIMNKKNKCFDKAEINNIE